MNKMDITPIPTGGNVNGLQSETVGQIAKALANAQANFTFAGKGSEAVGQGGQKRRYADLQSVLEAVRQGLSQNGIAICQQTEPYENGFSVRTLLVHESGEWLASLLPIPDALWRNPPVDAQGRPRPFNPMQQLGSCITYARRYALSALAGISQDDDDGESLRQAPSDCGNERQNHAPVEATHSPVDARQSQNRAQGRGQAQKPVEARQTPETKLRRNTAPTPQEQPAPSQAPAPWEQDNRPEDAPASKEEFWQLMHWLKSKGITDKKDQREFVCHQCGLDPQGWNFFQLTVGDMRILRQVYAEANADNN